MESSYFLVPLLNFSMFSIFFIFLWEIKILHYINTDVKYYTILIIGYNSFLIF